MYDISPKLALKVHNTMQKCIKPESKFLPMHKVGDKSFKGIPAVALKMPEELRQERISLKRKNAIKFIDMKPAIKAVAQEEQKAKKAKLARIEEVDEKFVASEVVWIIEPRGTD